MEKMFLIFVGISVLFFVLLGVRELLGKRKGKVCAICFAFSLGWIVLLVLYFLGKFEDKSIIALMMGMTLLGLFYLWERSVKERVLLFRLPFLLTLVLVGYSLLEGIVYGYSVIVFLGFLWVVFVLIYFYNSKGRMGGFMRKVVECCKKW